MGNLYSHSPAFLKLIPTLKDPVSYGRILVGTIMSLQGVGLPSFLHRWEVVRMKYDFKDLMAFGMFLLALLTFVVLISR